MGAMNGLPPLKTLFQRRRRRVYIYAFWLLGYLPLLGVILENAGPWQSLYPLVPILIVISQIIHPTLIGWAVIAWPSLFMTLAGAYSLKRHSGDWADDTPVIRTVCILLTYYGIVSIALILACPKSKPVSSIESPDSPASPPGN